MKRIIGIGILLLFCMELHGQEVVFIESTENGNGILQQRFEECFIITPHHVIEKSMGSLKGMDQNGYEITAEHTKSFPIDLALLKVLNNEGIDCTKWKASKNINNILQNSNSGFIEFRDEVGKKSLIHVNIIEINQNFIKVQPKDPGEQFVKGNSGAGFFLTYNNEKLFAGMLISISDEARTGNILQADDIERHLSGFFFEHAEKPRIGLLILDENNNFSMLTNQLSSSLEESANYSPVTPLPQSAFIEEKFEPIFSGENIQLPQSLEKDLQQLLLGKLSFSIQKTPNNMFMVNTDLDGRIYLTEGFKLLKNLDIQAKGVGRDEEKAKKESLKYLLKNLEKELK